MLENKWAIITGASSGIGLATAKLFAYHKANLILISKNKEKLKSITNEFEKNIYIFETDLSNYDDIKKLFSDIRKITKKIDILVNNAGIIESSMLMMTQEENIKKLFENNTFSQIYMAQFTSKFMLKHKKGSIINITSIMGISGAKAHVAYSSSKAAIIGLTKSLAKELAPFVRVNAISPGIVDTPLISNISEEKKDKLTSQILLKRLATPKEIANAILFLASDMSSYITETVLEVDGGLCSINI